MEHKEDIAKISAFLFFGKREFAAVVSI